MGINRLVRYFLQVATYVMVKSFYLYAGYASHHMTDQLRVGAQHQLYKQSFRYFFNWVSCTVEFRSRERTSFIPQVAFDSNIRSCPPAEVICFSWSTLHASCTNCLKAIVHFLTICFKMSLNSFAVLMFFDGLNKSSHLNLLVFCFFLYPHT